MATETVTSAVLGGFKFGPPCFLVPKRCTSATSSAPPRPRPSNLRIHVIVGVPLRAMSFPNIFRGRARAFKNIVSEAHWLQVLRIYADSIVTLMIYSHPAWYWANVQLIRESMSQYMALVPKPSVPAVKQSTSPKPTPISLINPEPKAIERREVVTPCAHRFVALDTAMPTKSSIMRPAVAAIFRRLGAPMDITCHINSIANVKACTK